jgi:hypothetical protein
MENETNEFEDMGLDEEAPDQEVSETITEGTNSMVESLPSGQVYDYTKAPEHSKAPPRKDLNGKTVTIEKADIILPAESIKWDKSKDKQFKYKGCKFILQYDIEGQREYVSGVKVFKTEHEKYSHPTIRNEGKSQATFLKQLYADYKGKDINSVALKEFMSFLNGKPKCEIKTYESENPETNKITKKNLPGKFL